MRKPKVIDQLKNSNLTLVTITERVPISEPSPEIDEKESSFNSGSQSYLRMDSNNVPGEKKDHRHQFFSGAKYSKRMTDFARHPEEGSENQALRLAHSGVDLSDRVLEADLEPLEDSLLNNDNWQLKKQFSGSSAVRSTERLEHQLPKSEPSCTPQEFHIIKYRFD